MRIQVCAENINSTLEQLFKSSKKGEDRVVIHNIQVRINKIFDDFKGQLFKIQKGKIYYLKNILRNLILQLNFLENIQNRLIKFVAKLGSFQNMRRRKKKAKKLK